TLKALHCKASKPQTMMTLREALKSSRAFAVKKVGKGTVAGLEKHADTKGADRAAQTAAGAALAGAPTIARPRTVSSPQTVRKISSLDRSIPTTPNWPGSAFVQVRATFRRNPTGVNDSRRTPSLFELLRHLCPTSALNWGFTAAGCSEPAN
nr:hypothetical protein [Nocardioidaceae bacterium]